MDAGTKNDIEKRTWQVLKDAGLTEPPIKIEQVIGHLKLHLDYYSLEDPGFLQRLKHKFDVKTHRVLEAVRESKIIAAWFPESSKILIDGSLPELKKTFPQYHEVVHSILPWHKEFYLGDTAQTLSPSYQEDLELEANYGASELWFCGPNFRQRCPDFALEWKSVPTLKEIFGTTLTTTLWKFVISQDSPTIGVVSTPNWKWKGEGNRCRHLITSPAFKKKFSKTHGEIVLSLIEGNISQRRGGMLGTYEMQISDDNGDMHIFRGETFFNRHELLTLIVYNRKMSICR